MDYPFVSILLATYNRKSWLEGCLESLFNQDYPKERYEIIVINDGSNDGTDKVLRAYEKKRRVHLYGTLREIKVKPPH